MGTGVVVNPPPITASLEATLRCRSRKSETKSGTVFQLGAVAVFAVAEQSTGEREQSFEEEPTR